MFSVASDAPMSEDAAGPFAAYVAVVVVEAVIIFWATVIGGPGAPLRPKGVRGGGATIRFAVVCA